MLKKKKSALLHRIWLNVNVFQWLTFASRHATLPESRLYYTLGCNAGHSEAKVQVQLALELISSSLKSAIHTVYLKVFFLLLFLTAYTLVS